LENAIRYKEVALVGFIDIESACDNTGFESLFWSLVIDELLTKLIEQAYGVIRFDIMVRGTTNAGLTFPTWHS
jgi:hypothetical protein